MLVFDMMDQSSIVPMCKNAASPPIPRNTHFCGELTIIKLSTKLPVIKITVDSYA
jgi:hypothetical protein